MKFSYILPLWFAILVSNSQAQDSTTIPNDTIHDALVVFTRPDPCISTVTFYQLNGNEYTQIKE